MSEDTCKSQPKLHLGDDCLGVEGAGLVEGRGSKLVKYAAQFQFRISILPQLSPTHN